MTAHERNDVLYDPTGARHRVGRAMAKVGVAFLLLGLARRAFDRRCAVCGEVKRGWLTRRLFG